jgi:hypothetical protein
MPTYPCADGEKKTATIINATHSDSANHVDYENTLHENACLQFASTELKKHLSHEWELNYYLGGSFEDDNRLMTASMLVGVLCGREWLQSLDAYVIDTEYPYYQEGPLRKPVCWKTPTEDRPSQKRITTRAAAAAVGEGQEGQGSFLHVGKNHIFDESSSKHL